MRTNSIESQAVLKPPTDWPRYSSQDAAWLLNRSVTTTKSLAKELGLVRQTVSGRWLFTDADIETLRAEIGHRERQALQ